MSRNTFKALSYVHIVTALAGAALTKLTPSPLYSPLGPSVLSTCATVLATPLYTGISRCTYSALVGPWTCSLFLTKSRGNTALFAITLANVPTTASADPNGSDTDAVSGCSVS